jgi:hypothetical protein
MKTKSVAGVFGMTVILVGLSLPNSGIGQEEPVSTTKTKITSPQPAKFGPPDLRHSLSSRNLKEKLKVQEAAAAMEARRLRDAQNNQSGEESREKLISLLSAAFDLKLELEETQVKELRAHLDLLDHQIGERRRLRDRIVSRRATDLVDGTALDWNNQPESVPGEVEVEPKQPKDVGPESPRPSPELRGALLKRVQRAVLDLNSGMGNVDEVLQAIEALFEAMPGEPIFHAAILEEALAIATSQFDAGKLSQADLTKIRKRYESAREDRDRYRPASGTTQTEATQSRSVVAKLPSPQQIRAELEPFVRRIQEATERARGLEQKYVKGLTDPAPLTEALSQLAQARRDCHRKFKDVEGLLTQLSSNYEIAELLSKAATKRFEATKERYLAGNATDAEVTTAIESSRKAEQELISVKKTIETTYAIAFSGFEDAQIENDETLNWLSESSVPTRSEQNSDLAMVCLEAATQLKLEFVRFDELNLWFKAALRVRESGGTYKKGDLIVTLNQYQFDSPGQAVDHLQKRNVSHDISIVLPGGLTGVRQRAHFSGTSLEEFLVPVTDFQATIQFEVPARTGKSETVSYINGVCIWPNGLVVLPIDARMIPDDEPILAFGAKKGSARKVASDEQHGITLVKIDSPDQSLFHWVKCRRGRPAKGQRLTQNGKDVLVQDVGQKMTDLFEYEDAFVIGAASLPKGTPLFAVDQELQGIVIHETSPVMGVPAIHIQKLLDQYRESLRHKEAAQAEALD